MPTLYVGPVIPAAMLLRLPPNRDKRHPLEGMYTFQMWDQDGLLRGPNCQDERAAATERDRVLAQSPGAVAVGSVPEWIHTVDRLRQEHGSQEAPDTKPDGWVGSRTPMNDADAETARTTAYWAWLDQAHDNLEDSSTEVEALEDGLRLVRLGSAADADYEAAYMRHSIGHSWDKYSGYGDIFSLRSPANTPLATILVAKGVVVHVREEENARLSNANTEALEAFSARLGWTIKPEPLPFDYLNGDDAPNTRFKYLYRDAKNRKAFATEVFAGRLSGEEVKAMAETLREGRHFLPSAVGLEDLATMADEEAPHDVLSVRYVHDEPTSERSVEAFHADWMAAAEAGWLRPRPPVLGR